MAGRLPVKQYTGYRRGTYNGKFYRLFSFWDSRGETHTLIVCTHGILKKTNKTPKSEIEKALIIKENYFMGLLI